MLSSIYCSDTKKFEGTKGVIRSRKSKKNIQCNGQKEKGQKEKRRNNILDFHVAVLSECYVRDRADKRNAHVIYCYQA